MNNLGSWKGFYQQFCKPLGLSLDEGILIFLIGINELALNNSKHVTEFFRYGTSEKHVHKALIEGRLKYGIPVNFDFIPYMIGPYSFPVHATLKNLDNQQWLTSISKPGTFDEYLLSEKSRKIVRSYIEQVKGLPIFRKLVNVASLLRLNSSKLEKMATLDYALYLDSSRDILYLSQEFKNRLKNGKSIDAWNISFTIDAFTISLTHSKETSEKPFMEKEKAETALRDARRKTPTARAFSEIRLDKKSPLKFFMKTEWGESYIYNTVPEIYEIWDMGNEFTKNSLKKSIGKSIGLIDKSSILTSQKIGRRNYTEFTFRSGFTHPRYSSSIPIILDLEDLMTSLEVVTNSVVEVFWKLCTLVKPYRLEVYPLAITKIYDILHFD